MSNTKQTDHIVKANKMVTATDFLFENLNECFELYDNGEYDYTQFVNASNRIKGEAKAIEKQQIIEHSFNFYYDLSNKKNVPFNLISENRILAEEYYNDTFN